MTLPYQNINMVKSLPEWMLKGKSYQGGYVMGDDLIIKKGDWWYADCTYKGVRIRDSLKTKDRQTAIEHLFELQLLVREGRYQFHKVKFEALAKDYSPQVDRENKLRILRVHLEPVFKGKRLSEVDVQSWAESVARDNPESTALSIMRVARELGFQVSHKSIKFQPGKKFDGTQILSEEMALDIVRILAESPRGKKYASICRVAMYSTMPLSDLIHLRKQDVVFSGKDAGITYARRKTRYKGKSALFVPMTNKLREAFAGVPTPLADEGRWFPPFTAFAVSKTVSRAFIQAGWHHGRAMHNFRHFGACYLVRCGVPLTTIQELMGHSDFNTTLIYARTDRETLIEGMKKFDAI